MSIYKVEYCQACKYSRTEPKPLKNKPCPKCGATMKYQANWWIACTIGGRRIRQSVGGNRKLAEARLGQLKADAQEGRYFKKSKKVTWDEAAKNFERWVAEKVKPDTLDRYKNSLEHLKKAFSGRYLDELTGEDVAEFRAERLEEGVKTATINRDVAVFKHLYNTMEDKGVISANPFARLRLPAEADATPPHPLKEAEKNRLLAECDGYLRVMVLVALETGLRRDNVTSLKWSEVDWQENALRVKGKRDKTLVVPMTQEVRDALKAWKASQKVLSPYVFHSDRNPGHPIAEPKKAFKAAVKRAKITNFRWHDLRHTFAVIFYERTRDWKALQAILGHSSITTTMNVYMKFTTDEQRHDAMRRYEAGGKG